MKKFTFIAALFMCSFSAAFATIIKVNVSDFQFQPKTVNAKVMDTIQFVWKNGNHTTTSVTIPAGAVAWDRIMDSAHKSFRYVLRVAGTYKYKCTPHGVIGMNGTIRVTAALSAGLSDITLSGNDLQAQVNWKTKTAADIAYFSVERSTDGNSFREIKRILPSAGNAYSYTDNDAKEKYVYYQVKMVDKKGNAEYSNILMQTRNVNDDKLVTSLSPNPVSKEGHLLLQFSAGAEGAMRVKLFTQTGKLVKEVSMYATKGINNGHLHMGGMPPGTYYIVCTLGAKTEKHTIMMK
ncbi:T9SS type A sorting domain-containing protein [Panacibacter sp. DH6]|uniref:T9SS type A sorting domain-containing protein n=1 Tax=Panacibacter microcysteis TaxID=2793269 RepID=A0A931GY71_9BACT|nr:plastocyanin/azurin family copper-binding protein [Panacibacter microcysteis]MBG9374802.1 T9SS type A sorting domain-containing protein [Panacibacter microcysteis]